MRLRTITAIVVASIIAPFSVPYLGFTSNVPVSDVTVLQLNTQINEKKSNISELRKRITTYQQNIENKRKEASTLENSMSIIEDEIEKTTLDLQAAEQEIEQLALEIKQTDLEIQEKGEEFAVLKSQLAEFVRQVYTENQKDILEILLTNDSLSEFFDQVRYLEESEGQLNKAISRMKVLQGELAVQKMGLENNKKRQEEIRDQLMQDKDRLDEQRTAKQQLVVESILSAEKFEQLLRDTQSAQSAINSEISTLEQTKQDKLKILAAKNVSFVWPVDPTRGISTLFRDPSYPFRHVFEHAAIDIRAYQGTPIRAVEDGYVARTYMNGKQYAYIMILHDKGLSSVYGHPSVISVRQDTYVKKGAIIGYTGGMPGSAGSGKFTTGPHLHFEVRQNGIPVDPLKFLP